MQTRRGGIKNAVTSEGLTAFNAFLEIWHMPLLFVLSGAGTWFALGSRTAREYARERVFRLFVPLVCGILTFPRWPTQLNPRGGSCRLVLHAYPCDEKEDPECFGRRAYWRACGSRR